MVNNFAGELRFEGQARLIFKNPQQQGIVFSGGANPRIIGFRATYVAGAAQGATAAALTFTNVSSPFVDQVLIESSPGIGIYFNNVTEPKVSNVSILNTQSYGIRFDNCRSPEVVNLTVSNSSDDGVVVWSGQGVTDRDGGQFTNIIVRNSNSNGISIIGQSKVTVSGFVVDTTATSALYCATESGTNSPDSVLFQGGFVNNSRDFGVEFKNVTGCSLVNAEISGSANHAVYGTAPSGSITVQNVRIRGSVSGNGFLFDTVSQVRVSESTAENTAGYGFFFNACPVTAVTGLKTLNVSQSNSLHRAIWFQSGAAVTGFDLTVMDTQSTPTGNIIGTYAMQKGTIKSVVSSITNGTLQVQNSSPAVSISLVN